PCVVPRADRQHPLPAAASRLAPVGRARARRWPRGLDAGRQLSLPEGRREAGRDTHGSAAPRADLDRRLPGVQTVVALAACPAAPPSRPRAIEAIRLLARAVPRAGALFERPLRVTAGSLDASARQQTAGIRVPDPDLVTDCY